jgi:hypothetical protein
MGIIKVDLRHVDPPSFDALPKGTYHCKLEECELEQVDSGPNEGKDMLRCQWNVEHGEHEGRKIFGRLMLFETGKGSLGPFKNFIAATGRFDPDDDLDFDPDDLIGVECQLVVRYVPANEEEGWDAKNEIRRYKALSEEDLLVP